jgi:proprotein convertase subtilisin/kexin type 5
MLCNVNCKTCVNTSTTCLSCGFSSIGANLYLLGNQCLLNCPHSYFADINTNQCVSCHLGCALCFGSAITQCSKCKTENILGTITPYYLYGNDTVCATTCPSGQFINPNLPNACISCDPGCLACSITSTNCTLSACNAGYYYYSANSSCLRNCPNNFYNNNLTGMCSQCP